jgi:Tfp pilus assembly protein PilF
MKKGDAAEARRHLETALSIDPSYEPARQALAYLATK